MNIHNIAGYRFSALEDVRKQEIASNLRAFVEKFQVKGTILLSHEGVNLIMAGEEEHIKAFKTHLDTYPEFSNMDYRESTSDRIPFTRMLVRVRPSIIPLETRDAEKGEVAIDPEHEPAPYIEPETLNQWYEEGKDFVILDTRNDYEVKLGKFEQAEDLDIKKFRIFNDALDQLDESYKDKIIVTYCTGGIRCEKAAPLMIKKGFKNVYQLQGGILNYFKTCGGKHWEGECMVFDKRVAVSPDLKETDTIQCFSCRNPLLPEEQRAKVGDCPHCGSSGYLQG